jgi:signal transduction histidine kinase
MLLTITHKLGNFLSIYRVNIEILSEKCSSKALERLDNAYSIMEKDFSFVTKSLKRLSFQQKEEKKLNVKNKILEVLSFFGQSLKDKNVSVSISDVYVKMDEHDLENILFSIFENIAKYSKKNIHIKMCKDKKYVYIFIRNDFKSVSKGSGIGLKLAEFLVSQYGGELKTRVKNSFLTVIVLPVFSSRFINEKV